MLQTISATMMELSSYDSCYWDNVTLYDGPTENSPILYSYCTFDTSTITSSRSSVLVVFQTDDSVNYGRFALSWTFAGKDQGGFTSNRRTNSLHIFPTFRFDFSDLWQRHVSFLCCYGALVQRCEITSPSAVSAENSLVSSYFCDVVTDSWGFPSQVSISLHRVRKKTAPLNMSK